jgi:hypothetical protein
MNASIFFKGRRRPIHLDQLERVVLNAVKTTVMPLEIFCANKALERLAFGDSTVLRTRRSALAPVYV